MGIANSYGQDVRTAEGGCATVAVPQQLSALCGITRPPVRATTGGANLGAAKEGCRLRPQLVDQRERVIDGEAAEAAESGLPRQFTRSRLTHDSANSIAIMSQ